MHGEAGGSPTHELAGVQRPAEQRADACGGSGRNLGGSPLLFFSLHSAAELFTAEEDDASREYADRAQGKFLCAVVFCQRFCQERNRNWCHSIVLSERFESEG